MAGKFYTQLPNGTWVQANYASVDITQDPLDYGPYNTEITLRGISDTVEFTPRFDKASRKTLAKALPFLFDDKYMRTEFKMPRKKKRGTMRRRRKWERKIGS